MKKITLMLLSALFAVFSYAQGPASGKTRLMLEPFAPVNKTSHVQGVARDGVVRTNSVSVAPAELVTPPAGVEAVTYYTTAGKLMVYTSSGWQDYTSKVPSIQVIVDGSDIYIAGLAYWVETAWIKGTISGTTATFPAVQQVDEDPDYPEWISGSEDGTAITDVVFEFNQEAGTLVSQTQYIGECASETDFSVYAYWSKPSFSLTMPVEVAATPANPVYVDHDFTKDQGLNTISAIIPSVDGDGNPLNFDKLFYSIWYEKDNVQQVYVFTAALYPKDFDVDTKEVPYTYQRWDVSWGGEIIYLEDDPAELATWTKVGIQSIYYGAGERHASGIVWSDGTTGIKAVKVAESENAPIYNLKGQRVNSSYKGLVIKNGKKFVVK